MVNRSRVQSQEQPSFLSCWMMMPPCFSFHAQTRLRNSSRPRSCAVLLFLFLELLLDHHLRGDAGVVGAGEPENFPAVHAGFAGEDVLDGVVEHMPHVQHAGDVGRGDDDGIRGLGGRGVGHKTLPVEPEPVPFFLNGLRLVGFWNFRHKLLTTDEHGWTRMGGYKTRRSHSRRACLKFIINPTLNFVIRR